MAGETCPKCGEVIKSGQKIIYEEGKPQHYICSKEIPKPSPSEKHKGKLERFVGKEELEEATTEFLKKIGVAKVGHRPIVEVTKEKEEVKICSLTEVRHHYPDGKIKPQIGLFVCATIPKELWNEVRRYC